MIIFTDLDGTLLDHETYSFDAARPALDAIKSKGITLIFATSKTAAEITPLRRATGIVMPAIVENGAGIDWPGGSDPVGQGDYGAIRAVLDGLPVETRRLFRGFGDMSADDISELTGLDHKAARLAKRRDHSEPGLFSGDAHQRAAFLDALARSGLSTVEGGRFLTVSNGASKADRMADIVDWWSGETGGPQPVTLALGDAQNDVAMLETADFGVVVANCAHPPLPVLAGEAEGRISRTGKEGPSGWNIAVLAFIEAQSKGTLA